MSSLLADFHFLRPLWLLSLLLLPFAWWLVGRTVRGAGDWSRAVDPHLLPHLLEQSAEPRVEPAQWLAAAALAIFALAMAGPSWERLPEPLQRQEAALVIALDLSPRARATDLKPDRLIRARYKLADLFRLRSAGQTALVAYAGEAFTVAPLTDDAQTIANLIDALDPTLMPVAGQRADLALRHAERLLQGAGLETGDVLLITDRAEARDSAVARELAARGVRVSVLGLGGAQGAPVLQPGGGFLLDEQGRPVLAQLQPAGLEALARAGGGRYAAFTPDGSDLASLQLDRIEPSALRDAEGQAQRFRDAGWMLLPALMLVVLLGFRRGWLALVLLLPLGVPAPAYAFGWSDLWQRADQRAAAALRDGDAERARELAQDPALRGAAAYRTEDWAAAAESFAQADGPTADYNRGNALARAGRFEDAIEAYESALLQQPDFEDAQANLDAVRAWQEQQERQPQQGGDGTQEQPQESGSEGQQGAAPENADSGQEQSPEDAAQDGQGESAGQQGGAEDEAQAGGQPQSDAGAEGTESGDVPDSPTPAGDTEDSQRALREAIDQALAEQAGAEEQNAAEQAPAPSPEDLAEAERRQSVEQWLRRVPDDPGALLRRKFALEYQRRLREGTE